MVYCQDKKDFKSIDLLELVEGQTQEEDNEEVVGVPENLKVGATNELKGGRDHQEERNCDDVTCDTRSCHKTYSDWVLFV